MTNKIRNSVEKIIADDGVTFETEHCGTEVRDNKMERDIWNVTFRRDPKQSWDFDFYTGVGLRKNARPVAPSAAGVLYSLIADSAAYDMSFSEWCADFGYSDDSIKAMGTYTACREIRKKLRTIFSRAALAELQTALEDY